MTNVAIIGAGMAGLATARTLRDQGIRCSIFEAVDHVGGAVTSERYGDVTVDRGFQVFNSWYPAVKEILRPGEYAALNIKNFQPGIETLTPEGPALIVDPVRAPAMVPRLIRSKVGSALSLREMLRLQGWLKSEVAHRSSLELRSPSRLQRRADLPVAESLDAAGLTGTMRKRAIDPIVRAFLFDKDGQTSAAFAKWLMMTLLRGTLAIPENGMSDLSDTMARIPGVRLELNAKVESIEVTDSGTDSGVTVHVNGGSERFSYAVLAVDSAAESQLIGTPQRAHRGLSTWWFLSDDPVGANPVVTVDGCSMSCLDSAVEVTSVAPSYAPGRHLIAGTAVHPSRSSFDASRDIPSEAAVRDSLGKIYDANPSNWQLVTRHDIPQAIPLIEPQTAMTGHREVAMFKGRVALAGAHNATPTVDGAIRSGQRAARKIISELED